MGRCQLCGGSFPLVSDRLGACLRCIREKPEEALKITDKIHAESRKMFGLPPNPPRDRNGVACGMCANDCRIGVGQKGFCGLVCNMDGRIVRIGGTPEGGVLQWYYDPLPTNCVAWWFCPGCTGAGYPKYAYKRGAEAGYSNLAVFYGACSYDCLFCQNWHYRDLACKIQPLMSAESLAEKADDHISYICYDRGEKCPVESRFNRSDSAESLAAEVNTRVSCVCFFGGDPSVQMPHALKVSELTLERARQQNRILRICWETNGYWKKEFALQAADFSLASGGNVKIDLKTWTDTINKALSGVSNTPTLESFKLIGDKFYKERTELPVLTVSTLLVPGYIDVEEVKNLARFIAEVDPSIPYTLLAFYPTYILNDLPTTSREQADQCYKAARKHLKNVRIGNINLLS